MSSGYRPNIKHDFTSIWNAQSANQSDSDSIDSRQPLDPPPGQHQGLGIEPQVISLQSYNLWDEFEEDIQVLFVSAANLLQRINRPLGIRHLLMEMDGRNRWTPTFY